MQRAYLGLYKLCLSTIAYGPITTSFICPNVNRVSSANARKSRAVARLVAPPQIAARHFHGGWKWSALTLQADVSSEDSALMSEGSVSSLAHVQWLTGWSDCSSTTQHFQLFFFFLESICFFLLNIRKKMAWWQGFRIILSWGERHFLRKCLFFLIFWSWKN